MEGSSSVPRPSESARAPGNASKYLSDLPSRGLFSTPVVPSNHLGDMRVYTCDHNTSPPGGQLIKTNPKNILIRALTLKQKSEPSLKNSKAEAGIDGTRKRTADKALNGRASSKRPMTNAKTSSRKQEGAEAQGLDKDFHRLTVEKLRAILKEGGLSPTGKKDELIARLKGANI